MESERKVSSRLLFRTKDACGVLYPQLRTGISGRATPALDLRSGLWVFLTFSFLEPWNEGVKQLVKGINEGGGEGDTALVERAASPRKVSSAAFIGLLLGLQEMLGPSGPEKSYRATEKPEKASEDRSVGSEGFAPSGSSIERKIANGQETFLGAKASGVLNGVYIVFSELCVSRICFTWLPSPPDLIVRRVTSRLSQRCSRGYRSILRQSEHAPAVDGDRHTLIAVLPPNADQRIEPDGLPLPLVDSFRGPNRQDFWRISANGLILID